MYMIRLNIEGYDLYFQLLRYFFDGYFKICFDSSD